MSAAIVERGILQADVAEHAGMSASQLSRVLSGTKVFTLDQLDAVCSAIGERISDLVTRADTATRLRPGNVIQGDFGVRGRAEDDRAVAKAKGRDRGGDDGEG